MFGCLLAALSLLFSIVHSSAQTPANSLRLEPSGTGWQLRFTLAETGGPFRIVRSDQVQTFVSAGQVLATVGAAGAPRTGVIDVPTLSSSQAFFGLVGDQSIPPGATFTPPPGMVLIPSGTFVMGSPETEKARWSLSWETQHTVTLMKDFYMSKYEVTQREYLAVMGNNPSCFTTRNYGGDPISPDLNRPVENVTWYDATNYCATLTASERAAGRLPAGWEYRLPTETEWEYACRAGTSTTFHYGPDLRSEMANFRGFLEYVGGTGRVANPNVTSLAMTTAVGSYQPNAFGLYDMHGNVWEWCLDWLEPYPGESVTDPRGPATGSGRVVRGGSWDFPGDYCRSAYRDGFSPDYKDIDYGFRPVLAPAQP